MSSNQYPLLVFDFLFVFIEAKPTNYNYLAIYFAKALASSNAS
jgi:hypothetical protein